MYLCNMVHGKKGCGSQLSWNFLPSLLSPRGDHEREDFMSPLLHSHMVLTVASL